MRGIVNNIIRSFEDSRQVKVPICFLNTQGIQSLNKALETENPQMLRLFYSQFQKNFDYSAFDFVSNQIKKRRKIYEDDKTIISTLNEVKNDGSGLLLEISGNLYYLATLIQDYKNLELRMKKKKLNMKQSVRISLFIWIYLNAVELTNKNISELLLAYLHDRKLVQDKKFETFLNPFKNNKHPTFGQTVTTFRNLKLLHKKSESIFNDNLIYRNKISHAGLFYDAKHKVISDSQGKVYPLNKFYSDFRKVFEFLNELVFVMNNKNADLSTTIKKSIMAIQKKLLNVGRSGIEINKYRHVIIRWRDK